MQFRWFFPLLFLAAAPVVAQESPLVEQAKTSVRAILQNGDKARFEQVVIRVDGQGREYVCGRVDRPNQEGNYANQRYFVVKDDAPRLMPAELWQETWKEECGEFPDEVKPLSEEELRNERIKRMQIVPSSVVEE